MERPDSYLKEWLDSIKQQVNELFTLYKELADWRREHEISCEKRYQELKALLNEIKDGIDRRNKERDERERKPPRTTFGKILDFIGQKPALFIVMLLALAIISNALTHINPETIRILLGR